MQQSDAIPPASTALPRAFVGAATAFRQINAWGEAMGWSDRPFDFVLAQWLAGRNPGQAPSGAFTRGADGPAARLRPARSRSA